MIHINLHSTIIMLDACGKLQSWKTNEGWGYNSGDLQKLNGSCARVFYCQQKRNSNENYNLDAIFDHTISVQ